MKREEKQIIINSLADTIKQYSHFYLTDISELNAESTFALRELCFKKEIKLVVAKNTLLQRAFNEAGVDVGEIDEAFKGHTSILLSDTGNRPAKLIKEFRKKHSKPILKAAFVEASFYMGEENLETLNNIKSKEELIGDVVLLLQSPIKNVVSALQSGGNILTGVLKTLGEKGE